jgi:amino acid transporter
MGDLLLVAGPVPVPRGRVEHRLGVARPAPEQPGAHEHQPMSVAGSGILFLPSPVYVEAGRNSLLVWVLAPLVCLPMLLMFEDMVRANPTGNGIQACIRAGLGDVVGRCVPLLFLSLVAVGLPAGSLVAGRYVASALGAGESVTVVHSALSSVLDTTYLGMVLILSAKPTSSVLPGQESANAW